MYQLILLIHVFAAICIVALVLVQQGKGAAMGAAFGSGASQTIFGSRGSGSFLFRLTIGLAAVFFATSIELNSVVMHAYKQEKEMVLPFVPAQKSQTTAPAQSGSQSPVLPGEIPTRK
ncbi:MAG: preprotein translocase subunit SecG [Gammaproteobacteria bacterium]|nr:preprotein translocase subunit SecG [Gammaproteobacteria bacterium]MCW5583154.1 preprotein translocase subunit SecG [Gammaproteobacteria bacterium]